MSNYESPQINAGSIADIAFLLLIFFLVSTTMYNDTGILKQLPDKKPQPNIVINERNVFEVFINHNNEILIENTENIKLSELSLKVIEFIDNAAGKDQKGNSCDWCNGAKKAHLSDHPAKAVLELTASRKSSYGTYIAVQNEINAAYNQLRNKLSLSLYGKSFDEIETNYRKNKNNLVLKEKFENIRSKYPMLISEKQPKTQS